MKNAFSLVCLALAWALIVLYPADGSAGTVGKITGAVKDAAGTPLPGVNVVITGTSRGGTTDAAGYYLILSVEPGVYQLKASLIGYTAEIKQDVVVRADFTTRVDFKLQEVALEAAELTVVAERPPVEPDRTASRYIIDAVDISRVPLARSTTDLIQLQPGVSLDGALRIRGSDVAGVASQNETFVQIDGVKLVNNDGLTARNFMGINRNALQEMTVITGGMEAEYGNAQAGVISLVTRENSARYGGWGEYRFTVPGKRHWGRNVYDSAVHEGRAAWSEPNFVNEIDAKTGQKIHERIDYTGVAGHYIEASLSGPLTRNAGFFLSSAYSRDVSTYPSPLNRQPFNIQSSGNVTYRLGSDLKLKLGGVFARYDGFNDTGNSNTPGGARSIGDQARNLFLPGGYSAAGKQNSAEDVLYLVVTHTLSPRMFYDLRVSYQRSAIDTSGVPPATGDIRRDSKGFYLERPIHNFTFSRRSRYLIKGDLTSQVSRGHLLKGGFEITRFSVYQHQEDFSSPRDRWIRIVGKGDPVIGMTPFHPIQYAAYLQDKMEFQGLVINAGVRFDALSPGKAFGRAAELVLFNHYNSLTRFRNVPMVDSPTMTAWSPRIGVSHPITARSTIRFFTGVFRQFPDVQMLYEREFASSRPDQDLNKNGRIDEMERFNSLVYPLAAQFGFVDMKPEKTTSFEVGADWNFAGDYIASLTAFYKDQEGILRSGGQGQYLDEPVFGYNASYSQAIRNSGLETSRGFEISFRKAFSRMTSFNLSYNIQWAKGTWAGLRSWEWFIVPDSSYVASGKFFVGVNVDPATGQEAPRLPTQDEIRKYGAAANQIVRRWLSRIGEPKSAGFIQAPLKLESGLYAFTDSYYDIPYLRGGIDRRNYGSAQFIFSAPPDFHIKPLAGFRATMIYRIQTGTPWTYTPPVGPSQPRSAPVSMVTDVNAERDFQLGKAVVATVFAEVRNLWNEKDDTSVGFNYVQYGLQLPAPGDTRYERYGDVSELTRYNGGLGRPRTVVLGARVRF